MYYIQDSRSMVLYGPVFRREVRSWLPLFGPLLVPSLRFGDAEPTSHGAQGATNWT